MAFSGYVNSYVWTERHAIGVRAKGLGALKAKGFILGAQAEDLNVSRALRLLDT